MLEANKPIRKTLRPDRESSVDWENTQNIYIEGDNLDALKLLQESYLGKIKMIYIDPPYNTGKDFVYKDNFTQSIDEYNEEIGLKDEDGNKLFQNTESNGRFHSDWCSMIYPRLKLARNLLTDDGVIFISIDDNEVRNLKCICDEVFGEENFVATIAKKTKLTSNNGNFFAPSHEYILTYSKSIINVVGFNDPLAQENEEYLKLFKYEDNYSKYNIVGLYQPSLTLERSRNARYYIECPDGSFCIPPDGKRWRVIEPSYFEMKAKDIIVFKKTSTSPLIDKDGNQSKWNIYTKIYLKDRLASGLRPITFLDKFPNSEATKELLKLNIPFDFSKSKNLIIYLMKIIGIKSDDIILDFFSGSATTAHAVMQLNAEDNGNRKFIMVQLPETTAETSEAYKAGYKNICEIGKERIRRAGKKIKEEIEQNNTQLKLGEEPKKVPDIGFRVFKVDDTNMNDVYYAPKDYNKSMLEQLTSNIKDDRTDEDLLYGVLLDWGVELSLPHKVETIDGKKVHIVNDNDLGADLIACFEQNISENVVREIAKKQPTRVVFRDNSFNTDDHKINVEEIFKLLAPNTTVKVI